MARNTIKTGLFWVVETVHGTECIDTKLCGNRNEVWMFLDEGKFRSCRKERGTFLQVNRGDNWIGPFENEEAAQAYAASN